MANRDTGPIIVEIPQRLERYRCLNCQTTMMSKGQPKKCIDCKSGPAFLQKTEDWSI